MGGLSIIVPVLNEADGIVATLTELQPLRARGAELIVVDGGSDDETAELARPLADRVITSLPGRATQMNAGAATARGEVFLFLHADTRLPPKADQLVLEGLRASGCVWGRFDIRIEGRSPLLPMVAMFMNARSRLTGIATGDQAIFVTRAAFAAAGGFPDIALMEDVAISRRLKRIGAPLNLSEQVATSGRRWEQRGVIRTVVLMWSLRLSYFFGAEPARLARRYGYAPRSDRVRPRATE